MRCFSIFSHCHCIVFQIVSTTYFPPKVQTDEMLLSTVGSQIRHVVSCQRWKVGIKSGKYSVARFVLWGQWWGYKVDKSITERLGDSRGRMRVRCDIVGRWSRVERVAGSPRLQFWEIDMKLEGGRIWMFPHSPHPELSGLQGELNGRIKTARKT